MWEGTLVYTFGQGGLTELINAGVSVLSVKALQNSPDKRIVSCRFNNETFNKLKTLENVYAWVGKQV